MSNFYAQAHVGEGAATGDVPSLTDVGVGVGPSLPTSLIPVDRRVGLLSVGIMGLSLFCAAKTNGSTMFRTLTEGKFEFFLSGVFVVITLNYFYNSSRLRTHRVARKEERIRARYIGPVAREQPYYDLKKFQAYIDGEFHPKQAQEQL